MREGGGYIVGPHLTMDVIITEELIAGVMAQACGDWGDPPWGRGEGGVMAQACGETPRGEGGVMAQACGVPGWRGGGGP